MSALLLAAHSGHRLVAGLLLEKGADPNAAAVGYTALHAAALMGYDGVVKLLADHGAKINVKNNRGLTPLSGLTQRRQADVLHSSTADLLRKLGAIE